MNHKKACLLKTVRKFCCAKIEATMKKIYITPEIEVIDMASEGMLALSIDGKPKPNPGNDDDWADRYDAVADRRQWGNLWSKA